MVMSSSRLLTPAQGQGLGPRAAGEGRLTVGCATKTAPGYLPLIAPSELAEGVNTCQRLCRRIASDLRALVVASDRYPARSVEDALRRAPVRSG